MKLEKLRDLSIILINNTYIVISCDSCGGVGLKENDLVKLPPDKVAYLTMNVLCCELASLRVIPSVIINNVCAEMDDTGIKIINGIKNYMNDFYKNKDYIITGSTEENFKMIQTGIGLTAIGYINEKDYINPKSCTDDYLVVIGVPKIGQEVIDDKNEILNVSELWNLINNNCINEIIPAGSKGLNYEINQLKSINKKDIKLNNNIEVDLNKSAGPATCAIVTIPKNKLDEFKNIIIIPYEIIGKIC